MTHYRELLFGAVFGIGACVIDIIMHARMTGRPVLVELVWPSPQMLFYRALFLLFGLGLGVLLWQKSKREREARRLAEALRKLRHELAAPAIIIHANVQLLLTDERPVESKDTESVLRSIYAQSQKLQSALRE